MGAAHKLIMLAVLMVIGVISYQQYQDYLHRQEVKAFSKQFNIAFNQFYEKTEVEHALYSIEVRDFVELRKELEKLFDHKKFKQYPEFGEIYERVLESVSSGVKISSDYFSSANEIELLFETNPGLFADDGKYQKAKLTFKNYRDWLEDGYARTLTVRDEQDNLIDKTQLPGDIKRLIKSYNTIVHRPLAERIKKDAEIEPVIRASQKMLKWIFKNKEKFQFSESGEMKFFKSNHGRELANLQRDFNFQLELFKKRRMVN